MRILLLADIHGNFPALQAIEQHFADTAFDHIINCGDSLVYAPFANETLEWLQQHKAISILGNTDKKVIKLLLGQEFAKPRKEEKRIMYTSTAESLSYANGSYLRSLPISASLPLANRFLPGAGIAAIGIFHGSPEEPHEFLFADTPDSRFQELAGKTPFPIIVTGHSHTPYTKKIGGCLFINPGSAGRMFDGNPAVSCAVLTFSDGKPVVCHYRISYDVPQVAAAVRYAGLPEIYATMFITGKKLN
jgi:predicted phosphodiesterase